MIFLLKRVLKKSLFADLHTVSKQDHKAGLMATMTTMKQAEHAGMPPHHIAYDRINSRGTVSHIAANGQQTEGREHLAHGMKVMYKTPDMPKRRKATIVGSDEHGWHLKGVREGYNFGAKVKVKVVPRDQIWTEGEHKKDYARSDIRVGRLIKPEVLKQRAITGAERLGIDEGKVLTHPAIVRGIVSQARTIASKNRMDTIFRNENGFITNDDADSMELFNRAQENAMMSLRRQTAAAPQEMIDEFKEHLEGKKEYSRIYHTMMQDAKNAAMRYAINLAEERQHHTSYDTSMEDDFDSGMQHISGEIQEKISTEGKQTGEDKQAVEAGIDEQLKQLDDPVAEAIIKMKFGLGRFEHGYKEADIASALNKRLNTDEWNSEKVKDRMKSALLRLGKTKGMKDLLAFMKSLKEATEEPLVKSHIRQYTRQDGTLVQEHDDKRVKKAPDLIAHQNNHKEEIHTGAKLEHGEKLVDHLRSQGWKEREVSVVKHKNGAVAGKKEDMPEHEEIKAKNRDNSALQTAERQMKKMREAAMNSDDPVAVLQHMNTSRSNTYTAAIDDYREKLLNHYGHEVDRNKSATKFEKDGHAVVIGKEGDKHVVNYAGADTSKDDGKTIGNLTGKKEVESVDTGKKEPKFVMGDDDKSYTSKMNEVHSKFALVEADDLTTSHTMQGHVNKAYPQEIQPRERERLSSQMQMANIMNDIKPELFTGTGMAAHGSPIVGKDGAVESGNGRTIALIEAYKRDLAGKYKEHIVKHAEKYGLKPEDAEKMKNPVLVRVRNDDDPNTDRAEFAREANDTGNLGSSPAEQAWSDAGRIDDALLKKFTVDEDGEIYNDDNMDFINGFLNKLGKNEAASLRDADGDPNKKAIERIQNAVFTKVYGSSMLTELQAESAKPKIRNVLKALNSCVGDFAQVRGHDDLDVIPDMMEAIEYTLAHKDVSKAEMEHTLKNAQSLNFTGDTPTFKTDHATNMILAIADRSGSRSRLENVFRAISNEIKNEVAERDNPEVDMFAGAYQPKSKEQVVKQALNKVNKADGLPAVEEKPPPQKAPASSKHGQLLKEWIQSGDAHKEDPDDRTAEKETAHEAMHRTVKEWDHAYSQYKTGSHDYEIKDMPVEHITTPHQQEVSEESYKHTAKQIAAGNYSKLDRKHDVMPVLLGHDGSLLDGHHRLAAAKLNGEKTIPALVPKGKGTGKVLNVKEYAGNQNMQKSLKPGLWLLRKSKGNPNHGYHGHFASAPAYSIYPQPMDASKLLPKCKNPNDKKEQREYIELFMQQFGGTFEKNVTFTDASGKKLKISPRMFKDRKTGEYKIFKNGREQYLLMLAEALKNPTEIWEDTETRKGQATTIRRYVATYRLGNEKVSGVIVFDLMNGTWEGTTAHQRKSPDTVRTGNLIYTAEGIKKSRLLCQSSDPLPAREKPTPGRTNGLTNNISNTKNDVNKSLRSGLWLRKSRAMLHCFGNSTFGIVVPRTGFGNPFVQSGIESRNTKLALGSVEHSSSMDEPIKHFSISSHNTLQKSELPSEGVKTQQQNDARRSTHEKNQCRVFEPTSDNSRCADVVEVTISCKSGTMLSRPRRNANPAGEVSPPSATDLHFSRKAERTSCGDIVRSAIRTEQTNMQAKVRPFINSRCYTTRSLSKPMTHLQTQDVGSIAQKNVAGYAPSFNASNLYLLKKSHGGTHGRTDRRTENSKEGADAETGTGGSRRDGQAGHGESEIRKSQKAHAEQGREGSLTKAGGKGWRASALMQAAEYLVKSGRSSVKI